MTRCQDKRDFFLNMSEMVIITVSLCLIGWCLWSLRTLVNTTFRTKQRVVSFTLQCFGHINNNDNLKHRFVPDTKTALAGLLGRLIKIDTLLLPIINWLIETMWFCFNSLATCITNFNLCILVKLFNQNWNISTLNKK